MAGGLAFESRCSFSRSQKDAAVAVSKSSLPSCGVEVLAVLAKPDDQVCLVAAVGRAIVLAVSGGAELRRCVNEVVPRPDGVIGNGNVGCLEDLGVGHDDVGVLAGAQAVLGAVVLAGGKGFLIQLGGIDAALLGQVQERPAAAVFGNVLLVHLDDVRCVIGCGLGGQLVPVAAPFAGLGLNLDVRMFCLERIDDLFGLRVEVFVAPPGKPQGDLLFALRAGSGAAACGKEERATAAAPSWNLLRLRVGIFIDVPSWC